ncbi:hypothetical protein SAMN06272735_8056 [Streptomyces sp. TLI_55]|uniref:hypothetical protein n=1 Tax=Streptomyces sp. TLI_55 TaxID=1938861 RepID=UPI000BD13AC2|nr:hypothetical protein [Streptomyces sp. TLI_55]SNX66210.1 hypothetical protein SAMN06272735_8056 [Streptomyces sp. TLI_55]
MAIHVSPEVNNLLLLLIGERMLQADEDKAYQSHEPYARLGRQLHRLSDLIEVSVVEVGRALPPAVATRYVRAMNLFVDDRGRNALKDFAAELDVVAQSRVETSMNIMEAKWQIIAEIVRLLIELAVILVMSVFSGGSAAGKAAVARAQSRVTLLTILDNLMRRTHLMPSLSEAFDEAFTTFAVRLSMIAFGPDGRRPHGFDWEQILQDAVFGGITGMFHGAFEGVVDKFKKFFRKDHFDDTLVKNLDDDVLSKTDRNHLSSGHNNRDIGGDRDTRGTRDVGNDRNLRDDFGDGVGDAVLEGAAETGGEFVTVGLFTGTWALSGDTFLTAAGSALFMGAVFAGVAKFGSQFNVQMDAVNDVRGLGAATGTGTGAPKATGSSGSSGETQASDGSGRPARTGKSGTAGAGQDADRTRSTPAGRGGQTDDTRRDEETPVHDPLHEGGDSDTEDGRTGAAPPLSSTAPSQNTSGTSGTTGTSTGSSDAPTRTTGTSTGSSDAPTRTPTTSRRDGSGAHDTSGADESAPSPRRTVSATPVADIPARMEPGTTTSSAAPAPITTTSTTSTTTTAPPSTAPAHAPAPSGSSAVAPSSVAAQPRSLARTIPFQGDELQVLEVVGDGDCFFTSLLAGLHHQGHGSELVALDVPQLRQRAAEAYRGSAAYEEANGRDVLDVLLQDLGPADLTALTGGARPQLSAEQQKDIENQLHKKLYGDELRRLVRSDADRAVLTDLPDAAVRALQPGYQPVLGKAQRAEREELSNGVRARMMRDQIRQILTGDDTRRAEELWSQLVQRRYQGWAETRPGLADFLNSRLGDLVTDSILDRSMWTTPFFDLAPSGIAQALGLNITVVQQHGNGAWDLPLNPGAGRALYVHYNGVNHYSAIRNTPAPRPAETFVAPKTTSSADTPLGADDTTRPATSSRVDELIDVLRGTPVDQRVLDNLHRLSPATVDALLGSARRQPPPAVGKGRASGKKEKGKNEKESKEAKAARLAGHKPDAGLKKVLHHPGYATGDQFGIAAYLLADENVHVVVVEDPDGKNDRSADIEAFYRANGIPDGRVHKVTVTADTDGDAHAMAVFDKVNGLEGKSSSMSKNQLKNLVVPVGAATTWLGENFSRTTRDKVREAWHLDDRGFPQQDQDRVAKWLAKKHITVEPDREVIVLWSRFSGKRGDVHVEHDTSYTGMDQLLTAIHDRTKDNPPGPLVIIAGDAKVNPKSRPHYPELTQKHWENGLTVHDLTDFWDDKDGTAAWGGDTRLGQMRLYEYLNRQSGNSLQHLGFRSGNLEAMALAGHKVKYLEEERSLGGERMQKWHEGTSKAPLTIGYERIVIQRPPTRSGQIALEARGTWEKKDEEYRKLDSLTAEQKKELANLAQAFKHPAWVAGKDNEPGADKPFKSPTTKGFLPADVDKIADALIGTAPARPTILVTLPPTAPGQVRTLDGEALPDTAFRNYALAQGLASFTDADWRDRAARYDTVTSTTEYSDYRPNDRVLIGAPKDVPWRGQGVSFFAGHGKATRVDLALGAPRTVAVPKKTRPVEGPKDAPSAEKTPPVEGTEETPSAEKTPPEVTYVTYDKVSVTGPELGRYLIRWGGLGPDGQPIVLYSCHTGARPSHGGLPVAQHVANTTGRPVFAPRTKAGTALDGPGRVRPTLDVESDDGEGGVVASEWVLFLPEPSGDALAELAVHAGLHQGGEALDPWAANRTLQFVRTLRGTTGIDTGTDPALLRGLGALEALRWNGTTDDYTDGRMTPDLLTRITRENFGLPGTVTPAPDQYRAVLTAARTAAPDTAPGALTVQPLAAHTGPRPAPGVDTAPVRAPLWESGKGKGKDKNPDKVKESKEEKAARLAKKPPAADLKKVLIHPGYATGDQFGIATYLLGDENVHVVVVRDGDPKNPRDRSDDIAAFYRSSGIAEDRIHQRTIGGGEDADALAQSVFTSVNGLTPDTLPTARQLRDLVVPVGAATTWLGKNFSSEERKKARRAWQLDSAAFPQEDQDRVADWLAARNITVEPDREVIVLWSRFSGKRGDVHVEHDTSYTGMDQLLTAIHDRTKDNPPGPLVIIAGDARVNSKSRPHYPEMAKKHRRTGLAVHDLTDFWDDKEGTAAWGGDTRTGQMRLYEYLRLQSRGSLQHLGFRSGNLEAMALAGHKVKYLEEEGSLGGERMQKWHEGTSKAPLTIGYERIVVQRPPTLSGQIALEALDAWQKTEAEYRKTKLATPEQKKELANLAQAFKHPAWVPGKNNNRGAKKPWRDPSTRGFLTEDVDKIADALLATAASPDPRGQKSGNWSHPMFTSGDRPFRQVPVAGDGDCYFRSLLESARLQAPDGAQVGESVADLRHRAADRFADSDAHALLNRSDALEELLQDVSDRNERDRLRAALNHGGPEAEAVWRAWLWEAYPTWARSEPPLSAVRGRRLGDLVAESIRDVALWNTPFFDHAPEVVAQALGLRVVVVNADGTPDYVLNPDADRTVHVFYNGRNHYSALAPAEPAADHPALATRTDTFAGAEGELDSRRPPRLDRALLPPAPPEDEVPFDDSLVVLRGTDEVVREIADRANLPDGTRAALDLALRATPQVFQGSGWVSPEFVDSRNRPRTLRVTIRPHGAWQRFADNSLPDQSRRPAGSAVYVDDVQYEVSFGGEPVGLGPAGLPLPFTVGESHFTFGVRNGLALRPSDTEAGPDARRGEPTGTLTTGPGSTSWHHHPGPGTLTGPDGTVYDLVEPSEDGNNFWNALGLSGDEAEQRPLPLGSLLDRRAPFTATELANAGESLGHDGRPVVRFHATAGRIPDDVPLTLSQERELILTHLRAARRWNPATTRTAARTAADATGTTVTIVAEDGSSRSYAPLAGAPAGRAVILYQRGGEFLPARPRPPAGLSPHDPAFQGLEVTRADVQDLTVGASAAATWGLMPTTRLTVAELGLDDGDLAKLWQTHGHRIGPAVSPQTARQRYGIPEKNFGKFRGIARERGLMIDVRPAHPATAKWLDEGKLPRPREIQAETINDLDVHLGARAEHIGLVGYFEPDLPEDRTGFDGTTWTAVKARYAQRLAEFHHLSATMAALAEEDRFHVRDGLVLGHQGGTPDGALTEITDDHTVFDLATPGGGRLDTPTHDETVQAMIHNDMAVTRGAHLYWRAPRSPFGKGVFTKVLESHGPDGAPLLRFRPENDHARLVHYTPPRGAATGTSSISREQVRTDALPHPSQHQQDDDAAAGRSSK